MKPFTPISRALATFAILGSTAVATRADTLSFADSHVLSLTNWNDTLTLPQFDPALGTLKTVQLAFEVRVEGDAIVENLAPSRSLVTTILAVDIGLFLPDASALVILSPSIVNSASLSPFDGTIDFGGTSGASYLGLAANDSQAFAYTKADPAFALFVGAGALDFGASALGSSIATGSANLISQFDSSAAARLTVVYTFEPIVDCNGNGIDDSIDVSSGKSSDVNANGIPDECEGLEGCSHGYWKNHLDSWAATGYSPAQDFDAVFGVDAFSPDRTLLQALQAGGGGINNLGRQGVAALLGASHPGVDFPLTSEQVIQLVRDAIAEGTVGATATYLDGLVNLGCPLN